MSAALSTRNLAKRFGGLVATDNVSLTLERGVRHALIGPNGAGKTTLINLLTGVLSASAGSVTLDGVDVTALPPHQRVRRGLARTFQINQYFPGLTPLEAVSLAVSERQRHGWRFWRPLARDSSVIEEAADLLGRFGLGDALDARTEILPYGKQRLLEIAIALASKPKVLLLDEPAAGVPEEERHEILAILEDLPADVTVLLIEHDMDLVFSFAQRVSVLVNGALFTEGTPAEIAADPRVRAVYLGEEQDG
ncbi:MAG: ABC transporter ATP-binding protein [Elsteraceae bacterium]